MIVVPARPTHPEAPLKTRFFTQHDHGLLSGQIAHAFEERGEHAPARYAYELLLAIGMHDLGWDTLDTLDAIEDPSALPFDEESGQLEDFLHLSTRRKLPLYLDGIERCEALHPYAGLLISHHYAAFLDPLKYADIRRAEAGRRAGLAARLQHESAEDEAILADYERLKFFDLLSLYLCMRAPDVEDEASPGWVSSSVSLLDRAYTLSWKDHSTLHMDPFDFLEPRVVVTIPYKDLCVTEVSTAKGLLQAWKKTPFAERTFFLECEA